MYFLKKYILGKRERRKKSNLTLFSPSLTRVLTFHSHPLSHSSLLKPSPVSLFSHRPHPHRRCRSSHLAISLTAFSPRSPLSLFSLDPLHVHRFPQTLFDFWFSECLF